MDIDRLRDLLSKGLTYAQVAKELNCTPSAVSYAAKKAGLTPNKVSKPIDIELLRTSVVNGMSFSEFGRVNKHTLPAICKVAKKHNILPPGTNHQKRELPDQQIFNEYTIEKLSLDYLHMKYNVPVATIKRHLQNLDNTIKFRSMDQAKRPAILNNKDELELLSKTKSYRTIARELGVKVKTVTNAAKKFNLDFPYSVVWDEIEYDLLFELYLVKGLNPEQISCELEYPYGVILRQLKRAGFEIAKPGGKQRPSKHPQLNDRQWLYDNYHTLQKSVNELSIEIGTSPRNIAHHLRKHNILLRNKSEYLQLLLNKIHGNRYVYKDIVCDSQLELAFLRTLPENTKFTRNIELKFADSYCLIDFEVDDKLIEVKPKDVYTCSAVNRRRAVKQYAICTKNNIDLQFWSKDGYHSLNISDDDVYYAINWKLFFNTSDECAEWLIKRGFVAPEKAVLELVDATTKMRYCKPGNELNANFNNSDPFKLMHHFFPHFWSSTHYGYLPITAAWKQGNHVILKEAIKNLWENKKEINIYGLVKHIAKFYKDFATVSWFKPWIAAYIYDTYLSNGGTVIDPCCGWGGRFMGTVGKNIQYIGYDLNPKSIKSHQLLNDFLGSRVNYQPEFHLANSSACDFDDGDLLFTSPPYDNTELYDGINSNDTLTSSILNNIFRQFKNTIILNVPKRQEQMCCEIAARYGRKLIDRLEMKTASFMGRERTFEPILIF